MTDQQQPPTESAEASTTDSATVGSEDGQDQNHDCQQHLEFVEFEWVEPAYDDKYVCSVCKAEYRMVYLKAFLLDGEDFSLVEEYTDEIESQLEQHRNHDANRDEATEEPNDE